MYRPALWSPGCSSGYCTEKVALPLTQMKMDWFGPTEVMSTGAPVVLKYSAWNACRLLLNCQMLTTALLGFTKASTAVAAAFVARLGPVMTSLQPRVRATVGEAAVIVTVVAAVAAAPVMSPTYWAVTTAVPAWPPP